MVDELNTAHDFVNDDELLYRVVYAKHIVALPDGKVEIKSEAFGDRQKRPSVDRAHLRDFDPNLSRAAFGSNRGVVALYAREVRAISPLDAYDKNQNLIAGPQVDVEPKPIIDPVSNVAHAEIFGTPAIEKDNLFKRLKVSLSRIAERHIESILWPSSP